MLGRRQTTLVK